MNFQPTPEQLEVMAEYLFNLAEPNTTWKEEMEYVPPDDGCHNLAAYQKAHEEFRQAWFTKVRRAIETVEVAGLIVSMP